MKTETINFTKITADEMHAIAHLMSDALREEIHTKMTFKSAEEFLAIYCHADPEFEVLLKSEFGITLTSNWDDCSITFCYADKSRARLSGGYLDAVD